MICLKLFSFVFIRQRSCYFVIHFVEKYNKLCMVFIDLEKALLEPTKVLKWAIIRKEAPKVYENLIQDTYLVLLSRICMENRKKNSVYCFKPLEGLELLNFCSIPKSIVMEQNFEIALIVTLNISKRNFPPNVLEQNF